MEQDKKDWELYPEKYQTEEDGVTFKLKKDGILRFFENFSVQGISNDVKIQLENGKEIRLFDIKTKKIKDLAAELVPNKINYNKDDTLVGKGFTITYQMLDNLDKKPAKSRWRMGF